MNRKDFINKINKGPRYRSQSRRIRSIMTVFIITSVAIIQYISYRFDDSSFSESSTEELRRNIKQDIRVSLISVSDGDTIHVLREDNNKSIKVRLHAIDAPELKQNFGEHSKQCLEDELENKPLSIVIQAVDRYDRAVADIKVAGENINLIMIEKGCAWFYTAFGNQLSSQNRNLYREAQNRAKLIGIGLWEDANAQAPWNYRRANRGN